MKFSIKHLVAVVAVALAQSNALAAPTIDQNQDQYYGGFCNTGVAYHCGQSFIQTADNISGAGVFISPGYIGIAPQNLTINISRNATGTDILASGTATGVTTDSGWVDVFFPKTNLITGSTYYLLLDGGSLVASFGYPNPYASGSIFYQGMQYGTNYDLTFRTYSETAVTGDVPEPMSIGLMGIALAGLAFARSRKNA